MLARTDEHWHLSTDHAHWNESFYFNAFDGNAGWGCAVRVGFTPSTGVRDGFICLYLPDCTTGFIRTSEKPVRDEASIAAGGIELRCAEPFKRWNVHYDGPVHHYEQAASGADILRTLDSEAPTKHLSLELQLDALSAPIDYDARSVRMRPMGELLRFGKHGSVLGAARRTLRALGALPAMMDAHHYEQSMNARGALTLDGDRHSIAGRGQRDHSWGVRDMGVPASWRWVSCQFGDALSFNATEVDLLGLRVQSGFVHCDGAAEALSRWDYEAKHDTSPYWPDSMSLSLRTKSGRRFVLRADVTTPLPVIADPKTQDVLVTAARAEFHWEGRSAHGVVEFMERLS